MSRLRDSLDKLINWFNWFTRKNQRHNRALHSIIDLLGYIEEFFAKYRLQEKGFDLRLILENIGQARIDVVAITYNTRTRIKIAKDIMSKDVPPLLEEVYNDLEEVKRALFIPKLGSIALGKRFRNLHESFKKLLNAISGIEYK